MKKKMRAITLILLLVAVFTLTACGGGGGGDALKGTWTGTSDGEDVAWTFDGKGKCKMDFILKQDGTYVIDEAAGTVEINLEMWDSPTVYTFSVTDSKMTLTPPEDNPYAPAYDLTKK